MTVPERPPASAEFFASALIANAELRDAVLGDLAEEYTRIARDSSRGRASAWYWSQLLRSAIPFSAIAVSRGGWVGWVRLVGAVVVSYALLVFLVVRTNAWAMSLLGRFATPEWQMSAASLVAGVASGIVCGYVAALLARRSAFAAALALGAFCVALSGLILARGGDGSPLWYQIGLLLVVLPATLGGALIRAWFASRHKPVAIRSTL